MDLQRNWLGIFARVRHCLTLLLSLLALPALAQEGPSFDCGKATTEVERAICDHYLLAEMDLWLSEVYGGLRKTLPAGEVDKLKAEQKAWLKDRNACESAIVTGDETPEGARYTCLDGLYRARLIDLGQRLEGAERGVAPEESLSGHYGYEVEGDWGDLMLGQMPGGAMAFWISTVSGPTYHICELGGRQAKRGNDLVLWQSPEEPTCKVTIAQDDVNQVTVSSLDCSYYCGARGYFDFPYARITDE